MFQLLLPASLLFGVVTTATTSAAGSLGTTSSTCISAANLDACLSTTQNIVSGCVSTDYSCLCQGYNNIVQCFASSGCPEDARWQGFYSNQQAYCAYASVYNSLPSSTAVKDISSLSSSLSSLVSILTDPSHTSTTAVYSISISISSSGSGASGSKTTSTSGGSSPNSAAKKTATSSSASTTSSSGATSAGDMLVAEAGLLVAGMAFVAALL